MKSSSRLTVIALVVQLLLHGLVFGQDRIGSVRRTSHPHQTNPETKRSRLELGRTAIVPIPYYYDVETPDTGWTKSGFWRRIANPSTVRVDSLIRNCLVVFPDDGRLPAPHSAQHAFWYGESSTGTFIGDDYNRNQQCLSGGTSIVDNFGSLITPQLDLTTVTRAYLEFWTWWEIEGVDADRFDVMTILVSTDNGSSWDAVGTLNPVNDPNGEAYVPYTSRGLGIPAIWQKQVVDLSPFAGEHIYIQFEFRSVDELYNGFRGWFIDDIAVLGGPLPAPEIIAVQPSIASESTLVNIIGSNFSVFPLGSTVRLLTSSSYYDGPATVLSSTLIRFLVPPVPLGLYSVEVTNTYGLRDTLMDGFTVIPRGTAPHISLVEPDSVVQGTPVNVIIRGSNFLAGATAILGLDTLTILELSADSIMATGPPLPVGTHTCRVTNPDGQFDILVNAYTVYSVLTETIVITHGFVLDIGQPVKWKDYKWMFCMADAISSNRQLCIIRKGIAFRALADYSAFASIADNTPFDTIVGNPNLFSPVLNLTGDKDVVFVFDWMEESDRIVHGYAEAAGDALAASLLRIANEFPWLLNHLHFIGHSRGTVVNSECIERLIFYAAGGLLPANITIDPNIQMTTLDAHPAGHWRDELDPIDDDRVNSNNVGIGVVGWKSGGFKVSYIDNFYETTGTTGSLLILRGLDHFPGLFASFNLDLRFNNENHAHQLVHTWYHGTVDLSATNDEFNTGSGHTIRRTQWYSPPSGAREGFYYSRVRGGNLNSISSLESQLVDVFEDQSYGPNYLVFNGDFIKYVLTGEGWIPGWEKQGGGGEGHVDKYDTWIWNPHLELDNGNERRWHNWLYIPNNSSALSFRMRVKNASNDDRFKVFIGNSLVFERGLSLQASNYFLENISVPTALQGTVSTLKFEISPVGSTDSEVWIDDVSFNIAHQMYASVASPVNLHAYDAFGNHTGPTSDTTWVAEIPSSQYVAESDTLPEPRKTIILPPPQGGTEYRFVIESRNATGHFNFQIEDYTTGTQTVNIIYDTVLIQPQTVATCTVRTVTPSLRLSVDRDGNGTPDTVLGATRYFQNFRIIATAGANGSITPHDTLIVNYGDSLGFTIRPDSGYVISNVFVDGDSVGPVSSYTFRNITRNHTISARFTRSTSVGNESGVPTQFYLAQNYPNPFNPSTTIEFALPRSVRATLKVFDLLGREVATLVDENLEPGMYKREWNAQGIASGVYLYQLKAGEFVQTKKLVLLR